MLLSDLSTARQIERDYGEWTTAASYHQANPQWGAQIHIGSSRFDIGAEQTKAALDARRAEIQARADAIGLTLQSKESKDASAGR